MATFENWTFLEKYKKKCHGIFETIPNAALSGKKSSFSGKNTKV
jgi:hypothetical protein